MLVFSLVTSTVVQHANCKFGVIFHMMYRSFAPIFESTAKLGGDAGCI